MSRSPLRRSRLLVVAALSLTGALLAVAAPPAQADCARASVWIYKSRQGREYKYGPYQCVGPNNGHPNTGYAGWGTGDNTYPYGVPSGGGAEVWVPLPLP